MVLKKLYLLLLLLPFNTFAKNHKDLRMTITCKISHANAHDYRMQNIVQPYSTLNPKLVAKTATFFFFFMFLLCFVLVSCIILLWPWDTFKMNTSSII